MASVESIGACSLDFDVSSNENFAGKDLTASEITLHSNGNILSPSIEGVSDESPFTDKLTNGTKREFAIAEIKLPSYVGISCAISGYTNFSRLCRSRENSPARAHRRSACEVLTGDPNPTRYARSQSDCLAQSESTMQYFGQSPEVARMAHYSGSETVRETRLSDSRTHFLESKRITVCKQLQIPLKSTKSYITEVSLSNVEEVSGRMNGHSETTNGHSSEILSLAKEVGNGEGKSLVQQRIESLYGKNEEIKVSRKTPPKIDDTHSNGRADSEGTVLNGNGIEGSVSPPVFRHLNKDFRKQLKMSTVTTSKKSEPDREIAESRSSEKAIPVTVQQSAERIEFFRNGHDECDRVKCMTPPPLKSCEFPATSIQKDSADREGYKFLNLVDLERDKICVQVQKLEEEMAKDSSIPEEAAGKIRAACGKANLLMSQKFEQFRGLCWKNIEESPNMPFYTTASDLAGFWDMVMLQVEDIGITFTDIEEMRKNGWKEVTPKRKSQVPQSKVRPNLSGVTRSNPPTPKRSAKSLELAKAREEARKQLLAAKKRQPSKDEEEIAIFTAPANSNAKNVPSGS